MTAEYIRKRLKNLEDPEKAKILQKFFKTGPRQYMGRETSSWGSLSLG
jgi:hypothetical protein